MDTRLERLRRRERNRGRLAAWIVALTFTATLVWGSFTLRVLAVPAALFATLAIAWHWQPAAVDHRAWWRWTKEGWGR